MQHCRGIKLLLSGSHTLEEFRRWSSYLINAQVLKLDYLEEDEARELIEMPIGDFSLHYEPDAVQRVLDLTRGHPYLVQLLCMELVATKNKADSAQRLLATVADVEAVVPDTLERGQQFFADIELNQLDDDGRAMLMWLAKRGADYCATDAELAQVIDEEQQLSEVIRRMVQRSIVEHRADGVAFQVELIRCWFETESLTV